MLKTRHYTFQNAALDVQIGLESKAQFYFESKRTIYRGTGNSQLYVTRLMFVTVP